MQRSRSAGQGHGMTDAGLLGHFPLEGVDIRSGRGDPVGIECFEKHAPLFGLPRPAGKERRGSLVGLGRVAANPPTRAAAPRTADATARSISRATLMDAWPTTTTTVTTTTSTAM